MTNSIVRLLSVAILCSIAGMPDEISFAQGQTAVASSSGTLQNQLIGIWKLTSFERRDDPAGEWTRPLGDNPKGYFVYGEKGHVAIQLMRFSPPAAFSSEQPPLSELKAAYDGYIALFGTYSVDEAKHLVVQHIEGSLLPDLIGNDMTRSIEISGNQLILSVPKTLRIVAQRVE